MNNNQDDITKSDLLIGQEKVIINIGLRVFEESLVTQGAEVVVVKWSPPQKQPDDMALLLDEIL